MGTSYPPVPATSMTLSLRLTLPPAWQMHELPGEGVNPRAWEGKTLTALWWSGGKQKFVFPGKVSQTKI